MLQKALNDDNKQFNFAERIQFILRHVSEAHNHLVNSNPPNISLREERRERENDKDIR